MFKKLIFMSLLILSVSVRAGVIDNCSKNFMKKAVVDVKVVDKKLVIFTQENSVGRSLNKIFKLFKKTLRLDELKKSIINLGKLVQTPGPFFGKVSEAFELNAKNYGIDLSHIKKEGSAIFYANHPLSGAEGFAIMEELEKVRPDIKALGASYLESLPGFKENVFIVDVSRTKEASRRNKKTIIDISRHIKNGGSLLIFPAGSVSAWQSKNAQYAIDPIWREGFIKFAQRNADTSFYPLFVEGEPSKKYLKLRQKQPLLSNAYVFRELANQKGRTINYHLGKAIEHKQISQYELEEQIHYLRAKLYSLGTEYIRNTKGEDFYLGDDYHTEVPLIKNFEYYLMQWIESQQY